MKKVKSLNQSIVILTLTLLISSIACAQNDSTSGKQKADHKRLEEINSELEALDAQRDQLREEKENLQISLYDEQPEDEDIEPYTESDELFEMTLVDLMGVDVVPVGTLTQTTRRTSPGAITTISKEQISESGAHSLNEVLEIYVPGLQYSTQTWEAPHLGIRGITGDRDDKYLMLVNGRVMNERTHYGALSERDLPMMADIHHIDVIRGPGSAIYGPGAVSGVINIVTENGLTFNGMEVTTKVGAFEEFGSFEFKYGRKFANDVGAFFYMGMDRYYGADQNDAPLFAGRSYSSFGDNYNVETGKPVPFNIVNDNQAWANRARMKFHGQLTVEDFDFWARYTQGGLDYVNPIQATENPEAAYWTWGPEWWQPAGQQAPSGTGYEQFTLYAKKNKEYSDTFNMEYVLSYDTFRYTRRDFSNGFNRHTEDELFARALGRWTPNEQHSIAAGAEVSLEYFNANTGGNFNAWQIGNQSWDNEDWSTTTYSGMGEWQWNISEQLKTFAGFRADKNTYTETMWSPRGAVVYSLTDEDTLKFMATKSVRMQNAEESRLRWLNMAKVSDPETLENYELRWERQHNENLSFGLSGYITELDVIVWDGGLVATNNVGLQKTWGLEGEMQYKKDNWQLAASHNYTKLDDFDLNPGASTILYYDDNLANWSNHVTKLQAKYKFNDKLSVNSSARIYWGFPGADERASETANIDGDFSDAFDTSIFFNLGCEYQVKENLNIRLDGTNLLGFIDDQYNSRPQLQGDFDSYRCTTPSFILSMKYKY